MTVAELILSLQGCDDQGLTVVVSTDDLWSVNLSDVATIDDGGVTVLCLSGERS